jgi:hypothetical protein
LSLTNEDRCLRIEVDDESTHQPRIRTPDMSGGRGLVLVDRLASAWGVQNYAHHKTVWAELVLDDVGTSGRVRHLATAPPGEG